MKKVFCDECQREMTGGPRKDEYHFVTKYSTGNDYAVGLVEHHLCSKKCLISWVKKI